MLHSSLELNRLDAALYHSQNLPTLVTINCAAFLLLLDSSQRCANANLSRRRRDEERLRDRGVDGAGREGVGGGDGLVGGVRGLGVALRALDGGVGKRNVASGGLALDELLPGLVALVDDLDGVLLGLGLTREGKDVLGLAVGDLVDAEPPGKVSVFVLSPDETVTHSLVARIRPGRWRSTSA